MGNTKTVSEPATIADVAAHLTSARTNGRDVVLLAGAGTSIDAGIPLTSHLSDYLIRLAALIRLRHDRASNGDRRSFSYRSKLLEMQWPSRHDLNVQLMAESGRLKIDRLTARAQRVVAREMLVAELRREHPTLAAAFKKGFKAFGRAFADKIPPDVGYRALLSYLTEGDQALIDGCMDHFIRNREPTTVHQLLVFLARELRTRLFLTTNFDPLLETALANEHRHYNVYSITGESTIPAARLLAAQSCSVLKLHGGTHNIEMSANLDDAMSPSAIVRFLDIFKAIGRETPPLLLVLGYAGLDRRVMSMLVEYVRTATPRLETTETAIIWVSRTGELPSAFVDVNKIGRDHKPVVMSHYADGRLFLQDVLMRVTEGEFPVARSHYQAVAFVARTPSVQPHVQSERLDPGVQSALLNPEKDKKDWSLAVVHGEPRWGTSSQVARLVEALEKKRWRRVIWVDLAEIRTISTLADVLGEQFAKVDARLCPFWRPVLLDSSLRSPIHHGNWVSPPEGVPNVLGLPAENGKLRDEDVLRNSEALIFIRVLGHVLRRGEYILVLDSLEGFAKPHPGVDDVRPEIDAFLHNETRHFLALLRALCDEAASARFGDSKIIIAASPGRRDAPQDTAVREFIEHVPSEADRVRVVRIQERPVPPMPTGTGTAELAKAIVAACRRPVPIHAVRRLLETSGDVSEPSVEPQPGLGYYGRHVPALRRMAEFQRDDLDRDPKLEVDAVLKQLTKDGVLCETPGGGYWMHADVRSSVYRKLTPTVRWYLHDELVAYYWFGIYLRSRDVRTFLEYLFHRIASLSERAREQGPGIDDAWFRAAERVCTSIESEIETLLARGRIPSLLFLLRQLLGVFAHAWDKMLMSPQPADESKEIELRRLADVVCRVEAELLMASGHPHSALDMQVCRLLLRPMTGKIPRRPLKEALAPMDLGDRIEFLEKLLRPEFDDPISGTALDKATADIYMDVAEAIQSPFEHASERGHRIPDRWAEVAGIHREAYLAFASRLYSRANDLLEAVRKSVSSDEERIKVADSTARLRRRWTEFRLIQVSSYRFLPRKGTLGVPDHCWGDDDPCRGSHFNLRNDLEKPSDADKWELALENSLDEMRNITLTPRLRRHRCYLLTLQARIAFLGGKAQTEPGRSKVRSILRQAESHLARNPGAAERQALAVVRLTAAAFQVEFAEQKMLDQDSTADGKADNKRARALKELQSAFLNLEEFAGLIKEGRGELRWRFFHLLYSTRMELLRAQLATGEETNDVTRLEEVRGHLFKAGRHLTYALSNCGKRSDRRPILLAWWRVFEVAMEVHGQLDERERNQWLARLGMRWPANPADKTLHTKNEGLEKS